MKSLLLYSWGTIFCDFYIFISTEILSLAKNDIDRDISLCENDSDRDFSLGENDIDRDISLAENYIDREGQEQDKSKINLFFYSQNLSLLLHRYPLIS